MKTFVAPYLRNAAAAVAIATMAVSQAYALPALVPVPGAPAAQDRVVQVAADCHAIGTREAAQAGGQLAKATAEMRNGQPVCVIVVLMPAKDGQRPIRNEIVVPAG
jgi:hypothetical protein